VRTLLERDDPEGIFCAEIVLTPDVAADSSPPPSTDAP
jgi:hypothetical protein